MAFANNETDIMDIVCQILRAAAKEQTTWRSCKRRKSSSLARGMEVGLVWMRAGYI
jgi:hypothetical protein